MGTVKDKFTLITLIPLVLALLISISLFTLSRFLPQRLPFFYSLPWGERQLINLGQVLIVPASIVIITLVNLIINWQLHHSQLLIKQILMWVSLFCAIILTISFIKVIFIFL